MVAQAIATARAAGITADPGARRQSLRHRAVIRCRPPRGAQSRWVRPRTPAVQKAIDAIPRNDGHRCATRRGQRSRTPGCGSLRPRSARNLLHRLASTNDAIHARMIVRGSKTPATATRCSRCGASTVRTNSDELLTGRRHTHAATHSSKPLRRLMTPLAHRTSGHFRRQPLRHGAVAPHRPQLCAPRQTLRRPRKCLSRAGATVRPQDREHRCPPDPPQRRPVLPRTHPLPWADAWLAL